MTGDNQPGPECQALHLPAATLWACFPSLSQRRNSPDCLTVRGLQGSNPPPDGMRLSKDRSWRERPLNIPSPAPGVRPLPMLPVSRPQSLLRGFPGCHKPRGKDRVLPLALRQARSGRPTACIPPGGAVVHGNLAGQLPEGGAEHSGGWDGVETHMHAHTCRHVQMCTHV